MENQSRTEEGDEREGEEDTGLLCQLFFLRVVIGPHHHQLFGSAAPVVVAATLLSTDENRCSGWLGDGPEQLWSFGGGMQVGEHVRGSARAITC